MGTKGEQTKQLIRREAYRLFAGRGFKDVTMKDICESTGLSRGGLYRHYESTGQIFREIVSLLMENQQDEFTEQMQKGVPAAEILFAILARYEKEMSDREASLSIAIYEFFSNPEWPKSENSITKQYLISQEMWVELIRYGIGRNEFKPVNPAAIFDLIVFSYQGVRMYGTIAEIDPDIPRRIIEQIKLLLLPEAETT